MLKNIVQSQSAEETTVALVACQYSFIDYASRDDMAVDDLKLGYLYTALAEKGYLLKIFNFIRQPSIFVPPFEHLAQRILEFSPLYAFFFDSIFVFNKSLELSRLIKKDLPKTNIIYGNLHASIFNKEILSSEPHVDHIICGDAIRSLPLLIEALENNKKPDKVPGLAFRDLNIIKNNPPDFEVQLDSISFPFRPSLKSFNENHHQFFNIMCSRGCLGHCTFCSTSAFLSRQCKKKENRWNTRSARNIFAELQFLYKKGVRKFLFHDDNWIGDKEKGLKRSVELCQLIIEHQLNDIVLGAAMRPDCLLPSDSSAIQIMKQAGFAIFSFGLEASNERQLRLYGKKYDLPQVKEVISMLFENEIMVRIGYIMFFPYSTFDMLKQNADFLSEAGVAYVFTSYFSKLMAMSKLPIDNMLRKDGLIAKPTSYLEPGIYKYNDERMDELQRFLLSVFLPEKDFLYEVLSLGIRASHLSKKGNNTFPAYQCFLKEIGDGSVDLFQYCINAHESESDLTNAIGKCNQYSQKWKKLIAKSKEKSNNFKSHYSSMN